MVVHKKSYGFAAEPLDDGIDKSVRRGQDRHEQARDNDPGQKVRHVNNRLDGPFERWEPNFVQQQSDQDGYREQQHNLVNTDEQCIREHLHKF
ncbi:hypothetical protein D3C73_1031960 [compost metagenome]